MHVLKFYAAVLMFFAMMSVVFMFLSLNSDTGLGHYTVLMGIGIFSSLAILEIDRRLGPPESADCTTKKTETNEDAG